MEKNFCLSSDIFVMQIIGLQIESSEAIIMQNA